MTITLPYPPSVNTYWRQWQGRTLLSEKGRAYREAVAACCYADDLKPIGGRLAVSIAAFMPDNRVRDLDNICKAVLDGLAHGGAYADDGQIDDLRIVRGGVDKAAPRIEVTLRPLTPARSEQ